MEKIDRQRVVTTALLFVALFVSIPLTAGLPAVYCIGIPSGLMLAAFFSADKMEEDYDVYKDFQSAADSHRSNRSIDAH